MSNENELKVGEEVTINMPFTYTIGDEGPISGNVLNTVEDCMNEVRLEVDENNFSGDDVYLELQE